jgi:hypothetical protein
MRGIDHDPLRFRAFARQCRKDAVETRQAASRARRDCKASCTGHRLWERPSIAGHAWIIPLITNTGKPVRERKKGDSRAIWRSFSKNNSDMALDLAMSRITPNRAEAWQAEPAARQAVPPIGQIIY